MEDAQGSRAGIDEIGSLEASRSAAAARIRRSAPLQPEAKVILARELDQQHGAATGLVQSPVQNPSGPIAWARP